VVESLTQLAARLGLTYVIDDGLTLNSRVAISNTRVRGESGTGDDVSLTLAYQPSEGPWSGAINWLQSNAGPFATLGFDNGSGFGYDENGFSGSEPSGGFNGVGATNARRLSLSGTYRATDRLAFRTTLYSVEALGNLTSNSRSQGAELGVQWDLGKFNLLDVVLNASRTRFLADAAAVDTTSSLIDISYFASPGGPWSYAVGFDSLISSGGSYGQSSVGYNATVSYRIDDRQTLSLGGTSGLTRGYYPQDDRYIGLFYRYRILGNIALEGSYKWRDVTNLSASEGTSGAYRSSGFDLSLVVDLTPRRSDRPGKPKGP
jgi:hypothetical protein